MDPNSLNDNLSETLDGPVTPADYGVVNLEPQKRFRRLRATYRSHKLLFIFFIILALGLTGFGSWTAIRDYRASHHPLAAVGTQNTPQQVSVVIPGKNEVLSINAKLKVTNTTNLDGPLNVGGVTTVQGLVVNGDATLNGGIIVAKNGTFDGTVTASNITAGTINGNFVGSYSGNGSNLTSVDATALNNQSSNYYLDASSFDSGTLSDSLLSSNVPLLNLPNTFSATNTFDNGLTVQGTVNGQSAIFSNAVSALSFTQNGYAVCDSSGNCVGGGGIIGTGTTNTLAVFTSSGAIGNSLLSQSGSTVSVAGTLNATALQGDGSALTNLDASNLATGTISDALLSSNVPLLDQANNFSNVNTFSNGLVVQGSLSGQSGIFSSTVSALSLTQNGNQVCDTSGNCSGVGGGVTGSGTTNTIALFTGSHGIGNSIISQTSGVTVSVAGTLNATALQGDGSALTNLDASNVGSGILSVAYGGTGVTSFTSKGIVYGNGTGALQVTTAGLTGDCLIAGSGGTPTWTTCSSASGGSAPGGTAGGDLVGTYPDPTVIGLNNTPIDETTLANGNFLMYNGSDWVNQALTQGTGISLVQSSGSTTISIDNTVCTTSGNCSGVGGSITGTGTNGTIPVFTGTGTIGNSILTQSSSTISLAGLLSATSLQGNGSAITNLNATNLSSGTVSAGLLTGPYTGITGVGNLASGAISSGFGVISTTNSISTGAALGGGSLSVTNATTLGGSLSVSAATTLSSTLAVSGVVTGGTYNGQTISSAANFTGNLAVAGNIATGGSLNGQTLGTNSILQNLTLQGSNGLTLGVANTTNGALSFANNTNSDLSLLTVSAPSGSGTASYYLPSINGGTTDTVCLQALGNCAGSGGGIVGAGTTNYVARFTGTGTIGTGALYDNGTDVGIGTTSSSYTLNVNGSIGATTLYQNGYQVCDTSGTTCSFAPVTGSTSYVDNSTTKQTANFNVQSATTTSPTGVIQAASFQTADLLDLENSSGTVVADFDTNGDLVANSGSFAGTLGVSGATTITGTLAVTSGGATFSHGAAVVGLTVTSGATISGPIAANTVGNTINGLIINGGALSNVASIANSGGYTQSGSAANLFTGTLQGNGLVEGAQLSAGSSFAGTNYIATINTSGNPGYVGLGVRATTSQTADLQEFQNSNGVVESKFNATGQLTLGTVATSGTVYQGQLSFADGTTDGYSVTLKTATQANNVTLSIPADTNTTDTLCLQTLNNCIAAGTTTSSGTANYLAKFTGTSTEANSEVYDSGSFVGVNTITNSGQLSVASSGAGETGLFVQGGTSSTAATAVIQAGTSQTADLLDLDNSSGVPLAKVDASGDLTAVNGSFSGTLSVTGAATLNSTLAVSSTSTFTGLLTANGGIVDAANLTFHQTSTINTTVGNLTVDSATSGTLNLGTSNATTIALGGSNVTSTVLQGGTVKETLNSTTGVTLAGTSTAYDTSTIGSNLFAGFGSATGWSTSGSGATMTATHSSGTTAIAASSVITPVIGSYYQITYTLTDTAGSVNATLGGVSGDSLSAAVTSFAQTVQATSTANLTFVPTTSYAGTISAVSIQLVTPALATLTVQSSSGSTALQIQTGGPAANQNTFIGLGAGELNSGSAGGVDNTALGGDALQLNTSGSGNTATGAAALQGNTTGTNNSAFGDGALGNNTIGGGNDAFGTGALASNTVGSGNSGIGEFSLEQSSGSNNSALGYASGLNDSAGSQDTFLGYEAGYVDSGGVFTTVGNLQNATAIGAYAQVQASNSIVLGSVDTATKVGIGTTIPLNTFSVSPLAYSTGTASQTSGSGTISGSGTTWTNAMVGDEMIFANGSEETITAFTSTTSLTGSSTSISESTAHYRLHYLGLQVTSAGATSLGGTLGVTGATTLSSTLGVSGAVTLSSTLGVTGATTLSSATVQSASGLTLGVIGTTEGDLIIDSSHASGSYSLQASTSQLNATAISFPVDANSTDVVCLQTANNCGGGTVGGTGTANYVARFTAGTTLGTGLLYDNGSLVGVGTTTGSYTFNVNGSIGASSLYQNGFQVCDTSGNCGFSGSSGGGSYINNTTSAQTNANIDIQGTTGTVAATIQGASGQDIADFDNSSGTKVAYISSAGALIANDGETVNETSGSNATVSGVNATNSNTSATAATVNANQVVLTGTNNSNTGANTLNGVNFSNVTAATNNTFNGLYFGTGYNSILNYNGTSLISGAGIVQNAALSSSLQYTNITGVGALTSGSIASGFGTISTANNITTTTAIQGGTFNNTGSSFTVSSGGAIVSSTINSQTISSAASFTGTLTAAGAITASSGSAIQTTGGGNIITSGNFNTGTVYNSSRLSAGSSSAGQIVAVLRGSSSQTADLLELQDSSGNIESKFGSTGQLTLGTVATSGTVYQGQLGFADGTTDGFAVTLKTATQANNVALSIPADTNTTDTICLQTLGNCGGGAPATGAPGYINNTTTQQTSANINIAASTGVVETIQGAGSNDLLDLKNSSGVTVSHIDNNGNLYVSFINGATDSLSYSSGSNSAQQNLSYTNTNISSSTITTSAEAVTVAGTTNTSGSNIINDLLLNGVSPLTGNTFNGIYIGSGYNSILNYNGTSLINGSGYLQNAAINSSLTYSNITGVGALTNGSIASGFGTISTANNITTTATLQAGTLSVTGAASIGTTLAVTSTSTFTGLLTANGGITTSTVNLGSSGSVLANIATAGNTFSDTQVGDTALRAANTDVLRLGVANAGGNSASTVQITGTGLTTTALTATGATSLQSSLAVQGTTTLGVAGSSTGQLIFANSGTTNLVTLQASTSQANATTLTIPTDSNPTDSVCLLTLDNCNTTGTTMGSGTTNYVARFTGASTLGTGLLYDNGSLVGVGTTTGSYALNVNGSAGATTLYQNGNQVCDTSNNCSDEATTGTDFIRNQTTQQTAANFNIAANSGVAATIQGASGQDIADFLTSASANVFKIDQNGNVTATGSTTTTLTSSTNNAIALTTKIDNTNTGSGTVSQSGLDVVLSGSANSSGSNINNGLKLANVTSTTGNVFNGITFGTGYNSLLSYNGTTLLDGNGLLQNAALSSSLQYTNITGVGALTSGSIASGFGTISTANNITTTATLQGNIVNATSNYQINATTVLQTPGTANLYIGQLAGNTSATGSNDTASGYNALHALTSGSYNTANGSNSLAAVTTGSDDNAYGNASLQALIGASNDTALGTSALHSLQGGSYDTAIGNNAGYNNTSGANDTYLGYSAGYSNTGSNDVFLGYEAGYNETGSNKLYIANSSTSSPLIYGDFSAASLTFNGSVTTTGTTNLQGTTTIGIAGSSTGQLVLTNASNSNLITLQASTSQANATVVTVPADSNTSDALCLQTLNNCATTGITTIGTLDGGTANANAASISGGTLYLQSASASNAGLINTGSQTLSGAKTFNNSITLDSSLTASGAVLLQDTTNSTSAFQVQNATSTAVLTVDTTNARVCINLASCNNALGVEGNIAASGSITGGVGSPDYAEDIPTSDPSVGAADVVSMDPDNSGSVVKDATAYDSAVVGVISTHPGFVTNADAATVTGTSSDGTERPLALSGRVPVNVSNINGDIEPGDYLTSSSIPGVAMKATAAGPVIGKAMTAFTGGSTCANNASYSCGTVTVFIDNTYYDPTTTADEVMQGGDATLDTLTVNSALNAASINVGGMATIQNLTVTGDTTIEGNLQVSGTTSVVDLSISGHIITSGTTPIAQVIATAGTGAAVTVTGDDTAGTISLTTGANPSLGDMAMLTFNKTYGQTPHILITPNNGTSAPLLVYPDKQTSTGFSVDLTNLPAPNTTYTFEYFVVQ